MRIIEDPDFLVSAKILIGDYLDPPGDEEAFITLREMETIEALQFQEAVTNKPSSEIAEVFCSKLPQIIVDHSLWKSDSEKMSADEVAHFVRKRLTLFTGLITEYKKQILFTRGKKSTAK